jgi:hypothetical protein
MPEDSPPRRPDPGDPGMLARDLTERFHELIERMNRLGQAGLDSLGSGMPNLISQWMSLLEAGTIVTALPVRQVQALAATIRAQRDQVRGLQAQLDVFEQQLTGLEKSLQPLLEWGEQWTRMQESVLGRVRDMTKPDR